MTTTLTHASEIIADLKGCLSHEIVYANDTIEIDAPKFWLTVDYEAETEYVPSEPEIGVIGGYDVTSVKTNITLITDEEGNEVETDKDVIEAYLNENLNLICRGNEF